MGKLIIIDGCDGVGKGYLVNRVSKSIPTAIMIKILDRPKDNSITERQKIKGYYETVLKAITTTLKDHTVIMDRYFVSEIVYSHKRGYDCFDDAWFELFEEELIRKMPEHLFVLVTRNKEEIKETFKTRGEEYIDEKDIDEIVNRYDRFYDKTCMNKIKITSNQYDEVIKWSM